MARLAVITHEYDVFLRRNNSTEAYGSPYLLFDVLRHLQSMGHQCLVVSGPRSPGADAALLHVDSTKVEDEYLRLASNYRTAINFETGDISKRRISRLLLQSDSEWDGPVIVKSDYNNNGLMEDLHNRAAVRRGRVEPHPNVSRGKPYQVLKSLKSVPADVWSDRSLVVERFVPERTDSGEFVLRTWVFMGERERCTRMVTSDQISKAADVLRYEPAEVPQQLRAERERLRFDFGKFDFVMDGDEPRLLDANRTPGVATAILDLMKKGARNLAEGLHEMLPAN